MSFFIEVVAGGLLAGVMYALVALGFVLIYKASGVFNFAQGSLVFFAALTFVSLTEMGWNLWLALAVTLTGDVDEELRGRAGLQRLLDFRARDAGGDHAFAVPERRRVDERCPCC